MHPLQEGYDLILHMVSGIDGCTVQCLVFGSDNFLASYCSTKSSVAAVSRSVLVAHSI